MAKVIAFLPFSIFLSSPAAVTKKNAPTKIKRVAIKANIFLIKVVIVAKIAKGGVATNSAITISVDRTIRAKKRQNPITFFVILYKNIKS